MIGVTGYTGFELATLLVRHPELPRPTFYVRETNGARCLADLFPQLRGRGEAPLKQLSIDAITASSAGTAFLATPHEVSADFAPALLDAGLRVIDLSGAFRFRSPETFSAGTSFRPRTLRSWPKPSTVCLNSLRSRLPARARSQPGLLFDQRHSRRSPACGSRFAGKRPICRL